MKKSLPFLVMAMCLTMAACGGSPAPVDSAPETQAPVETTTPAPTETTAETTAPSSLAETPGSTEAPEPEGEEVRQISVTWPGGVVIYALNDSPAAGALYAQLPLTIAVEDYSTNEKIFYPPQTLDTSGTPLAAGGTGTLAYYASWGDVVMFYGGFSENSSLFQLGQVVSGGELVSEMSGTVTIDVVE